MPDQAQVAASLSQLEGALESYLALGPGTPFANRAEGLLEDVRSERDEIKAEGASEAKPREPESEESSPSNFRDARKAAGDAMRNGTLRSDDGEAKTSEEEQPPDDADEKKKRGPRPF